MARDPGLEALLREQLEGEPGLSEQPMFGGRAFLVEGNLACAAGSRGMLVRLGKGRQAWALAQAGVEPMVMRGKPMEGWVWTAPEAFGDDVLRGRLIAAALGFVRSLPPKPTA